MKRSPLCCAILACLFLIAPAMAADLPDVKIAKGTYNRADMAGLKNFSEAKTEGDNEFRTTTKGQISTFSVAPWWAGDRLRPEEGNHYVLEVKFKDVATAPIVCLSYSGLSTHFGPSELHRIGGLNDGQWKTANVPVGWDQILKISDRVTFGFKADADVPIAEVKMRPATKEDETHYNAETREWVARVQAANAKKAPLNVKPRDFLKDNPPAAGPVAFEWPAMTILQQDGQPKDAQVNAPIKLRTCLNMIEDGSFGVYANEKDLTNVNYTVSDLTGPEGKLAGDVTCRTAEYCLMRNGTGYRWFPLRLWPAYAVSIPQGRSQWFVFNVRTYRGKTKPGVYKGTVNITSDQGNASLPVEVNVLYVDLLTMDEAHLFMGGCTTGLVPAHNIEFAAAYNQNGINLWYSGVAPKSTIRDNHLSIDFTYLDNWMADARAHGCVGNVWFLGGNPYGFPHTLSIFRDMGTLDTRDGRKPPTTEQWFTLQADPQNRAKPMPHDRELMVDWVRQTAQHAREKNWPEVIMTPFDEPAKWVQNHADKGDLGAGPWIETYFKDACAAIHEGDAKTRIYGSIHHINRSGKNEGLTFLPDIDIFCTNAIHEDPTVGDKVRAAGKTFWQYTGGDLPDQQRYGFGFFFASYGSTGSLRWAYNWGPGFDPTESENCWMYAWDTPFDTIPAPSFEGQREGWDDRRIIETYKKKFANDADAMTALQAIFKVAPSVRATGGTDTVNDFYTATGDASKMDQWRNTLLDRLSK